MQNRPPIVVILGHVDHGKTTLLDALRNSDIAASEKGGITQSTRAFIAHGITFIDTPGHAAFSQMRSRGGKVADIALLIVSAVDGVMPQTKESIELIQKTGLSPIVVLTKCDLPEADTNKVKIQLTEEQVFLEGMGGQIPVIEVSAKTGTGLTQLIEMITLVSQLNPAQADKNADLEAVVLESTLDSKRGPLAVVIVKNGTLKNGIDIFTSKVVGRVKALTRTSGENIKEAGLSEPVEILGLSEVVPVGCVLSNKPLKEAINSNGSVNHKNKDGLLNIILKADVLGSLEAVMASLPDQIAIISSGVGDIGEADVLMAHNTKSRIVGFNVKVTNSAAKLAETDKVTIRTYYIIYELLDTLKLALEKIKNPHLGEVITGKANILADFKIDADRIAGCKCVEGVFNKADKIRVLRGENTVNETKFKSLKLGKNDTNSIKTGQEFGAVFWPYIDFKVGDTIIAFRNDTL